MTNCTFSLYRNMHSDSLISIVIVSMNGEAVLPQCLQSIENLDWPYHSLEILLVDNGSTDATSAIAREWADRRVQLIRLERNYGFAGGNNEAMRRARGDYIVLLNDDTELYPDWARRVMNCAQSHPDAGILGTILLYPDNVTIQHAGAVIEGNALTRHLGVGEQDNGQHDAVRDCDYVTGACMTIRREVSDRIGLLDPDFWPIYFEEIDYCWRARKAGFRVIMTPARALHHESRTTVAYSPGFLKKYHCNRLRFIAVNYDVHELRRWVRAELRWISNTWRWLPLPLLTITYLRAVCQLPGWLFARWRRAKGTVVR